MQVTLPIAERLLLNSRNIGYKKDLMILTTILPMYLHLRRNGNQGKGKQTNLGTKELLLASSLVAEGDLQLKKIKIPDWL